MKKVKIRIPADLENPKRNEWRLVEVDFEKLKLLIEGKTKTIKKSDRVFPSDKQRRVV